MISTSRWTALCDDDETLAVLRSLGALQCSRTEVADSLLVDEGSVNTFFARCRGARKAFDQGRAHGVGVLRRAQFKLAAANSSMAIFLGKNYLDQAARREVEHSGSVDLSHATQRVRDKLAALAAGPAAGGDREGG